MDVVHAVSLTDCLLFVVLNWHLINFVCNSIIIMMFLLNMKAVSKIRGKYANQELPDQFHNMYIILENLR